MMKIISAIALMLVASRCFSDEPNDTFSTVTVLSQGILSISDQLTLANVPDTMLGVKDQFGTIYQTDDDGSPIGDGRASGITYVLTNSDSIHFAISGFGDEVEDGEFIGQHVENGEYEVFVFVYNPSGEQIGFISQVHHLEAGVVDDYQFFDAAWDNGHYDVYIDNTVGRADVDYFMFTGLTPGDIFEARTSDPLESAIDTYLGWFDDAGELIVADDNGGGGVLSFTQGIVPPSGTLTFAVTGYGDVNFEGDHYSPGSYELTIELTADSPSGDLNHDGLIDAADYVVWRKIDEMPLGYELWRTNFAQVEEVQSEALSTSRVPEPNQVVLMGAVAILCSRPRYNIWLRDRYHAKVNP